MDWGLIMFSDGLMEYEKDYEDYIDEAQGLQNYSDAVIWGMDWTTETIFNQITKANINLNPEFQRRDAWDNNTKSKLIESLMLGFPVPQIILAEIKRNKYIVIDGKQRLITICQFYNGKLKLQGLDVLSSLNGKKYKDIENSTNNAIYATALDNSVIRTVVIRSWPSEQFLYSVFLRLNTGSKQLSPQELRQALHPGPFLKFLDDRTARSKEMMRVLNNVGPDARMRDIELALRYYGFKYYHKEYNGNLKEFLDNTCKQLNKQWDVRKVAIENDFIELERAINKCFDIFDRDNSFSKWDADKNSFSGRFNRSLYEVFTYYFSIPSIRNTISNEKFKKAFISLCERDYQFIDSISTSTKNTQRVKKRFTEIGRIILDIYEDAPIDLENLIN